MTAPAFAGDPTRIVPDILSYSFWDILDLKTTFSDTLLKMKEDYNSLLPTRKGRLRAPEYTTAKVIIHLLGHEMEDARKNRPDLYKSYMSNQADSLPVSTNRGQLRTMLDSDYSLRSFSNFIDKLMDAGIITYKRNTSRVVDKTTDAKGNERKQAKIMQGGRGDFILYINKKALKFFTPIADPFESKSETNQTVSLGEKSGDSNDNEITDNQEVTTGQVQILQPPHDISLETLRIKNNKRGIVDNVSAEPSNFLTAYAENEIIGDGEGKKPLNNSSGAATPKARIYVENLEKDIRISRKLPQNDREFYCKLLYTQVAEQLYPSYPPEYLRQIESPVKNLLNLHLLRLEQPIDQAFQTVSRAIYLTQRYLETHPKAYLYDPMTWLRLDEKMQSGTLRKVVDEWIPREEKRLLVYKNRSDSMVKWQYAVRFSDKVFLEVVKELKKGFSSGVKAAKFALTRLDNLFEKYDLPASAKTVLHKRFADRTYAIL